MPYEDARRLSAFYRSAFGWKMQGAGPQMGDYLLATTTESGPQGLPKRPGAINGGFFRKKPDWPAQHPSVVIEVADLRKTLEKVAKAGGEELGEPMDIPGIGLYISVMDTEGNRVGLIQPAAQVQPAKGKPKAKAKAKAKPAGKAKSTARKPAAGKKAAKKRKA